MTRTAPRQTRPSAPASEAGAPHRRARANGGAAHAAIGDSIGESCRPGRAGVGSAATGARGHGSAWPAGRTPR
eukprot:7087020-Prymnesium_polylepis.1